MIVASFAEAISIGAVLPFLGVLTSPDKIFDHELTLPLIRLLQISSPQELFIPLTLVFIATVILAGLVRIILLWVQTRVSVSMGTDFSVRVYELTLYQAYSFHILRNSSETLAGTMKANALVTSIIQPTLLLVSSVVILMAVGVTLFLLQPIISLLAFSGFALIYLAVAFVSRHRIAKNSDLIAIHKSRSLKAIQEGLGGIRDVLIDNTQSLYTKLYKTELLPMQVALADSQVLGTGPRFAVEALGIALIATLACLLVVTTSPAEGLNNAIPILGALAFGAQRLLPLLQQIYGAYTTIKSNQASIKDALDMLDQPLPAYTSAKPAEPLDFQAVIALKDLGFRYHSQGPWVLRNLNLEIPRGSRVGFIGATGSGKSTLLDVVMGLLTPTEGTLLIDCSAVCAKNLQAWRALIAHVPQSIYLSDASVAENIAFGVPKELIDWQRVSEAAQQAQIAQTIESWRESYNTLVGERGVRLSGGQRQRIGVARALYKRASILIFDEATSSLDNETEAAVMQAVETLGRDITILIIAHRLTTLKNCDQIVELADGGIKAVGGYEQMIRRAA